MKNIVNKVSKISREQALLEVLYLYEKYISDDPSGKPVPRYEVKQFRDCLHELLEEEGEKEAKND